jgi:hypothetical protein
MQHATRAWGGMAELRFQISKRNTQHATGAWPPNGGWQREDMCGNEPYHRTGELTFCWANGSEVFRAVPGGRTGKRTAVEKHE